ncbi:MAG: methionyl-tRNA formyltransferase, partial [Planctomycetes bacterium]|nr:methionyl-tRNA formyltransferase [Planctomycetota bacterium]
MRLVFLGSPPFATASFEALCARSEAPVALVTAPPRRAGRGRRQAESPLVLLAEEAGVPVLRPESARDPEFLQAFAALEPDLGVVVSFGQLLVQDFLDIPRFGCVNLHGSLLPRWRGASPIQAALLAGDQATGVCLQKVVLALDAGAVLAERRVPLGPRATAAELAPRLSRLGAELLTAFLDQVGEGPLPAGAEQDESRVTVCRKLKREHARIEWAATAEQLDRQVRAMAGWPVAFAAAPDGPELRVHEAVGAGPGTAAAPGTALESDDGLGIACRAGPPR